MLMAIMLLTMVCYFWASLHVGYKVGMGTAKVNRDLVFVAQGASSELDSWLRSPSGPNWGGVKAIGVGFGGSILLMAFKLQFPAWPLHPVAFPLAFCFPIDAMLPAIIISWMIKLLLLRYGGLRAHRKACRSSWGCWSAAPRCRSANRSCSESPGSRAKLRPTPGLSCYGSSNARLI